MRDHKIEAVMSVGNEEEMMLEHARVKPIPVYPISLPRLYDACVRDSFTLQEVSWIAEDPALYKVLGQVVKHVYHPTKEELGQFINRTASATVMMDIDYHLRTDRCPRCCLLHDIFSGRSTDWSKVGRAKPLPAQTPENYDVPEYPEE